MIELKTIGGLICMILIVIALVWYMKYGAKLQLKARGWYNE